MKINTTLGLRSILRRSFSVPVFVVQSLRRGPLIPVYLQNLISYRKYPKISKSYNFDSSWTHFTNRAHVPQTPGQQRKAFIQRIQLTFNCPGFKEEPLRLVVLLCGRCFRLIKYHSCLHEQPNSFILASLDTINVYVEQPLMDISILIMDVTAGSKVPGRDPRKDSLLIEGPLIRT